MANYCERILRACRLRHMACAGARQGGVFPRLMRALFSPELPFLADRRLQTGASEGNRPCAHTHRWMDSFDRYFASVWQSVGSYLEPPPV